MGWTVSKKTIRLFISTENHAADQTSRSEINHQSDDVIDGRDKRPCGQRWVNLVPVKHQGYKCAKECGKNNHAKQGNTHRNAQCRPKIEKERYPQYEQATNEPIEDSNA